MRPARPGVGPFVVAGLAGLLAGALFFRRRDPKPAPPDAAATDPQNTTSIWTARFTLVGLILAAAGGLTSVVVLAGGIVLVGRLALYQFPWEIVINQLSSSLLFTVGVTEVIFPALAAAGIFAVLAVAVDGIRFNARKKADPPTEFRVDWIGSHWIGAAVFVVYMGLLLVRNGSGVPLRWTDSRAELAAVLAVVGVAISGTALNRLREAFQRNWQKSDWWLLSIFAGLAMIPLFCFNAITSPLPYARVCPTQTQPVAAGWLLGQAGDQLVLGTAEDIPTQRHILVVAAKEPQVLETDKDQKTPELQLPPCTPLPAPSASPSEVASPSPLPSP